MIILRSLLDYRKSLVTHIITGYRRQYRQWQCLSVLLVRAPRAITLSLSPWICFGFKALSYLWLGLFRFSSRTSSSQSCVECGVARGCSSCWWPRSQPTATAASEKRTSWRSAGPSTSSPGQNTLLFIYSIYAFLSCLFIMCVFLVL